MFTCLLLLLPENANHAHYSQRIQYKQYYFYPKAIFMQYWRVRTYVKIYYSHDKQIKQVSSCFGCQTFYDNLWQFMTCIKNYFIAISVNFITLPNFMTFYDFLTVCGSFAFIKEEHFGRTYIQLLFSWGFPGVFHFPRSFSRSKITFQEFPGIVATLIFHKE